MGSGQRSNLFSSLLILALDMAFQVAEYVAIMFLASSFRPFCSFPGRLVSWRILTCYGGETKTAYIAVLGPIDSMCLDLQGPTLCILQMSNVWIPHPCSEFVCQLINQVLFNSFCTYHVTTTAEKWIPLYKSQIQAATLQ